MKPAIERGAPAKNTGAAAGPLWTRARLDGRPDDAPETRSPFQRDYDRILFSGSFRRLADKTQVFPLPVDDHVHSRLTHSLEVAAIGRSLGTMAGHRLVERGLLPRGLDARDIGDAVSAACLAHDLGNPPFGHVGEKAIREYFERHRSADWFAALPSETQSDLLAFEGNAQAFSIVTRIEHASPRHGLNLTALTMGALLKYPCGSHAARGDGPPHRRKHGYHARDRRTMEGLAEQLGLRPEPDADGAWSRHPLAFLTEAADDIAYQIIDLEDGLRLGLVPREKYHDALAGLCRGHGDMDVREFVALERQELLRTAAKFRAVALNQLVEAAADGFMAHAEAILDGRHARPLSRDMAFAADLATIKELNVRHCYNARDVLKMEVAGAAAIEGVLDALVGAARGARGIQGRHLRDLLPDVLTGEPTEADQIMRVTDHVAGMTDRYIVRLYRELTGIRLPGDRD